MIKKQDIWNNAVEVMQAFAPYYQKEAVQKIEEANAFNVWNILLVARGVEPTPLTFDNYQAVNPYIAQTRLVEQMSQAVENGFLIENKAGTYHVAEKGYAVLDAFFSAAQNGLLTAPTLPTAEMNRLAQLLQGIVQATESAPKPLQKLSLAASRWTDPLNGAPAVLKVDQYLTDLQRFRDDAHNAAWQPTGVSGQEWETFTFVWKGDANTAAQLAEKLPRRGFSEDDYAQALNQLARRNWLSQEGDQYQLTPEGKSMRENVEEETDRLFYVGWHVLNNEDLHTLNHLFEDYKLLLAESVPAELVPA